MPSRRRLSLIAAVALLLAHGAMRTSAFAETIDGDFNVCERAGAAAEQEGGLPAGLLLAIGRIESGRWDPQRNRVIPWPWTINAAGKGQWFGSKDDAALNTRAQLYGGTRSIDVGCFQINLLWHPTAFSNLDEAFDPSANARYAARFLLDLYGRTGSWEAAVETYHSADPTLGFAYRQQVFASWQSAAPINVAATTPMRPGPLDAEARPKPLPIPMVVIAGVQIWTPMPSGTGSRVVAMPGSPSMAAMAGQPPITQLMGPLPVVSYRVMPHR
jgi:hypothetical protein